MNDKPFLKIIFLTFLFISFIITSNGQLLKVGIAGLKHDHINGILQDYKNGTVQILGIAESDQELVAKYKEKFHLPNTIFFTDLEKMLKNIKPDFVLAYNPVSEHIDVVEKCAPLGISVMVEKPLSTTLKQAERMLLLSKKYNIKVLTNFETSWYSSYQQVYNTIHSNSELTPLKKIVTHDGHSGPKEIGCSTDFLNWLTDPVKNGGGALMDFGCYGANLMTWLMHGQTPIAVTAIVRHLKPEMYPKVDDDATILVEYPGTTGIIEASWNWPFGIKDLEIFGKAGYLHAINGNTLEQRLNEKDALKSTIIAPYKYANNVSYLTDILNGKIVAEDDLSSIKNNIIVMKILDAARTSVKEGRRILLN